MADTLYYAIYDSTDPDPTDLDDIVNTGSAWYTSYGVANGNEPSPSVTSTHTFAATTGLSSGDYKCAVVWYDQVTWYSNIEISSVFTITAPTTLDEWIVNTSPQPRSYWALDDTSGTTVSFELGTFTGTYRNTPTLGATGIDNSAPSDVCIDLSGTSHWETDRSQWNYNNGDTLAFEGLIQPDTLSTNHCLASKGDASYPGSFDIYLDPTGKVVFKFTENQSGNPIALYSTDTSPIVAGNIYHIAVEHKFGTTANTGIYVDGVAIAGTWSGSGNASGSPKDSAYHVHFGQRNDTTAQFDGKMQRFALYRNEGGETYGPTIWAAHASVL